HPVFLGHPITRVLAKSNTPEDIMAALLAGKSYVTCSRNGPAIDLRHEDGVLNITVANARGCTIRLMTNKGVGAQFRNQATISVDPSWDFAYVVVKSIRIKAISNPVYFN
ncbi:MAG: hypothetical protein FWF59_00125, partial [Turicibacter sp.]|nr:hypothetical protein [Turicibacter sp.]